MLLSRELRLLGRGGGNGGWRSGAGRRAGGLCTRGNTVLRQGRGLAGM